MAAAYETAAAGTPPCGRGAGVDGGRDVTRTLTGRAAPTVSARAVALPHLGERQRGRLDGMAEEAAVGIGLHRDASPKSARVAPACVPRARSRWRATPGRHAPRGPLRPVAPQGPVGPDHREQLVSLGLSQAREELMARGCRPPTAASGTPSPRRCLDHQPGQFAGWASEALSRTGWRPATPASRSPFVV